MVRTFQITKALAAMPVIDNMLLAGPRQPGEQLPTLFGRPARLAAPGEGDQEHAYELLKTFNLDAKADDYAGTLSGRPAQAARARAGADDRAGDGPARRADGRASTRPSGRRLLDHMQRLRSEHGVSFLFVEHDMEVVMNHSDEVVVMAQGAVIAQGKPEEVRTDQGVIDAYLGGGPSAAEEAERRASARPGGPGGDRPMAEPVAQGQGLTAGYTPEVDILTDVAIDVHEHEIVTIVGPERRRQVDADEVGLRAGAAARGLDQAARQGDHRPGAARGHPQRASATCRSSTTSSPASRSARTSSSARSPAAATNVDERDGADLRPLPAARGAPQPGRRARCRAASARWWRWAGR